MPARPAEASAPAARPDLRPVAPGDGGAAHLALGADALALPSELAHILRVPLPLAAHRQRQAAAGFAVEELIAEPLEASHVGPSGGSRTFGGASRHDDGFHKSPSPRLRDETYRSFTS